METGEDSFGKKEEKKSLSKNNKMHSLKATFSKQKTSALSVIMTKLYTIFSLNSNIMLFLCKVAQVQNAVMPL